jgi:predicted phosphodiesterase
MKLGLLTDSHFGVRNDNRAFLENNKKFLDGIFFPYLKEQGIKTVVHLGDLVDKRKQINYYSNSRLRQDFIDPLMHGGFDFHWILGNHDIFYRDSFEVTAASELYLYLSRGMENFRYYTEPTEVLFDGFPILFLPWICDSNRELTTQTINTTRAKVVFGHLALAGFQMFRGVENNVGENRSIYQKFKLVCSGHYHHRSISDNIIYLGASGEHTWIDYNDPRGFHIFDTETLELTFLQNPYKMFAKVFYDDREEDRKYNFGDLTGKYVKVIIMSRHNPTRYDNFIGRVEDACPLDIQTTDDHFNLDLVDNEKILSEAKDTLTLIRDYVAQADNVINQNKLDQLFIELYQEANRQEK